MTKTATLKAFLEYMPCRPGFKPTPEQWAVHHYCKVLKKGSANKAAELGFVQQGLRINANDQATAIQLAAIALEHMIAAEADEQNPVALIPIPSSKTTLASVPFFLAARIADAIAAKNKGFVASPIVRFNQERDPSSVSGSRNPGLLKQALVFVNGAVFPRRAILIDDVYTTGAHMKAVASLLDANGCKVATGAAALRTAAGSEARKPAIWMTETFDYY